ncbi:MAG TPA: RNA polymerase sigma factor [Flavobacterium sp.]|jgi:RNA polymerase sigma-70 factor (ECF subfamily)
MNEALKAEVDPKELTEIKIIERILSGERELFELLMRHNNQKLYRAVRSYFSKDEDIEDIMQETYINAFQKLSQFKNDSLFSTWLIRIGINEALQKMRKLQRTKLKYLPLEENVFQIEDTIITAPELTITHIQSAQVIADAFETIPHKYRVVFMLREVEGMEISEIAASLDISQSNVKVRLHRAKSMIKKSLLKVVNLSDLFEFGSYKCDKLVDSVMVRLY